MIFFPFTESSSITNRADGQTRIWIWKVGLIGIFLNRNKTIDLNASDNLSNFAKEIKFSELYESVWN